MRIVLLTAFLGLVTSCSVMAQDAVEPPDSVPLWVVIVAGDDGKIVMSFPDDEAKKSENITVKVPFTVKGQNQIREENHVIDRKVGKTRIPKTIRWRPEDLRFFDLNGNPLETPEVVTQITKPTRMMAVTSHKIDPFFQAILKPETLVVVIPARNLVGQ